MTITVATTYDVSQQQVADLVVTALEGGSNYWLGPCEPRYTSHEDYSQADKYSEDMISRVFSVDEDDDTYVFDRIAVRRGVTLMANKFPHHFRDIINDNADAMTADVFMQCALLGDIVYG